MIVINNLKKMKKYYIKNNNTYVFNDDVEFKFDLKLESHINACNIKARDIDVLTIFAWNIEARNIKAIEIESENIKANTIKTSDIFATDIIAENVDCCIVHCGEVVANHIQTMDFEAGDVKTDVLVADTIRATNIDAKNISYNTVCYAIENIICETIKGKHPNSKHFVLDGKIEVAGEELKNDE